MDWLVSNFFDEKLNSHCKTRNKIFFENKFSVGLNFTLSFP